MLSPQLQKPENQSVIESIIGYLKKKGYSDIRADIESEEFERPTKLKKQGTDEVYVPNVTAQKMQGKYYFELIPKSNAIDKEKLIQKLTTLSVLAQMRSGKLFLIVPNGKIRFTNQLLEDYNNIHAEVLPVKDIK